MGEMIDKDALLKELVKRKSVLLERLNGTEYNPYEHNNLKSRIDENETSIMLVDGAPVIDSEPKWIPVTEELPDNGYHLWSAEGGEVKKDFYWDGHWDEAEKYGYTVLAWMPLPDPYEGGVK